MNKEQFNGSMARILSFTQAPKTKDDVTNLDRYLSALYEAIGKMDAFLFEKVTIELCRNMGRGQRPMPGQFWAVYSRLKSEDMASRPTEVCPSCNNTVWTTVRMMETKTGMEADFMEPCQICQTRHPLKDTPTKGGWVKVERKSVTHEQEMLEKVKSMSPRGVRFVMGLIYKHQNRMNFSDAVLVALMERAGVEPPQSNPPVERILEKLTVIPGPVSGEQTVKAVDGNPAPETYEIEE